MNHSLHWVRASLAVLTAAAALGLATAPAQAAPIYLIDATTNGAPPDPGLSNVAFSLTYEDSNLDMLFSLTELLAFTGVYDSLGQYYDSLLGLPTVSGTLGNSTGWMFGDSGGMLANYSASAASFTPFTTALQPNAVPEPAGLALLLAGLAALRLPRRRRA